MTLVKFCVVLAILFFTAFVGVAGLIGVAGSVAGACTWEIQDGPSACSDYGVNAADRLIGGSGYTP